MSLALSAADWLALFTHFLTLSLLAVGGAITAAPDMHRYLVDTRHWLTEDQFNSSIAVAQAAPGPKVSRRAFGRERRYPISNGYRE